MSVLVGLKQVALASFRYSKYSKRISILELMLALDWVSVSVFQYPHFSYLD